MDQGRSSQHGDWDWFDHKEYATPKVSSGDLHCVRPYRAGVVSMGWV